MKRGNGILLHISSLPSPYGIGTLGKEAYRFVDMLKKAKQSYWQVLPCTPTSYGDSPYQGASAFAYNPYFIDFDMLKEDGLLGKSDYASLDWGSVSGKVDYQALFKQKMKVLERACAKGIQKYGSEFNAFKINNSGWLFDYALFTVLKEKFDYKPYTEWDNQALIERDPAEIMRYTQLHEKEIERVEFIQFLFEKQWFALKEYANKNGIKIIGDMPIYVSADSADIWAHPDLFEEDGSVAGTPPDYFSADGQLWGNPLYNWDAMRKTGYDWWVKRIGRGLTLYDILRIDHFRGFEAYYRIPKGESPKNGEWVKGPAQELFDAVKRAIPMPPIIAEDLGMITDDVRRFLEYCGFPGLRVLQFGFDALNSEHLPQNYPRNCVVYTGTHDNNTTKGWFAEIPEETKERLFEYAGRCTEETVTDKLIRLAMMSVADIAIIPIQDILNLGASSRMNFPSSAGGNWQWRLKKGEFTQANIEKLANMTEIYGRAPDEPISDAVNFAEEE